MNNNTYSPHTTLRHHKMSGNLRASDARQIRVLGSGNVNISLHAWSAISYWNASLVLNADEQWRVTQDAALVLEMETSTVVADRFKSKNIWVKNVLDAIIKKTGSQSFMIGEESSNWPKIKHRAFTHGITVSHISQIIMEHRDALKKWSQNQAEIKRKQKAIKTAKVICAEDRQVLDTKGAEEQPAPEPPAPEQIPPDSWEDLMD